MIRYNNTINLQRIFYVLISGTILWLLLIILAPILKSSDVKLLNHISGYLYFLFEPVCHQISARSILLKSEPMAVCSRCFSFYLGGFIFVLYVALNKKIIHLSMNWILLICAPSVIDFILEKFGVYTDILLTRIITGFLLGTGISYLILYSISDFNNKYLIRWKLNNGKPKIN